MNPGFVKKVTVLSVLWFLVLGAVFGEWYLEQNDLRLLRDAVHKGDTFRHCAEQWGGYENVYVHDESRPADGKGVYIVLVNLRNHFFWSDDSYLNLNFTDDQLTGTTYHVGHDSILPWEK